MNLTDYEDIRPYNDSEAPDKIQFLLDDPVFGRVLTFLFKEPEKIAQIKQHLATVKSIEQLQVSFVYKLVELFIETTTQGLTCSGLEYLDHKKSYLFISNHRDIILDSAFMNYLIAQNGMNTTQIAIGDNLLIYDWIIHAVKLNRAFVVKRNIGVRELLESSRKLSSYIRGSITESNLSVWIAQREGRTKDGNDLTQVAVLKMLNLSNTKSLAQGFSELNVVPVSISYEIEPCGIAKVSELVQKEMEGFKKTSTDDLKSMAMGVLNQKGRVHFSFGRPILQSFLDSNDKLSVNEFLQELSWRVDHRLHQYFKLWPNNYVAYNLLNGTGEFVDQYTSADIISFKKMVAEAVEVLPYKADDVARRFTKMYARPVENSLIAAEVFRNR